MTIQTILHTMARLAFVGAIAVLGLMFVELGAQFLGTSLIGRLYSLGRMMDLAAVLLAFVVVILLREIRDEVKAGRQ